MPTDRTLAADLGGGYRRCPGPILGFIPVSDNVLVQEKLYADTTSKLILLRRGNSVIGTVLAVSEEAHTLHDLTPGDLVAYDEWQGGRWAFPNEDVEGGTIRCLIIRADSILFRVPRDEAPLTAIG